jgi:hypothetical protein
MSTPAPSPSHSSSTSGVDLPTLAITAIASAAAAFVCSQFWARGTLASAALTPVLVALIKEALARPAQVVSQAVPVRGVVRSASHPDEFEPVPERVAQQGEVRGRSGARPARSWRMAIITGLLGFLVCAVIITVPELVSGKATSGGGRGTTLFGGEQSSPEPATPTDTSTTTNPAETITVPPAETITVPPASTTTVPPVQTTPKLPTPEPSTTTEPDPDMPAPEPEVPLTPP